MKFISKSKFLYSKSEFSGNRKENVKATSITSNTELELNVIFSYFSLVKTDWGRQARNGTIAANEYKNFAAKFYRRF
jgi:hypothetical protein